MDSRNTLKSFKEYDMRIDLSTIQDSKRIWFFKLGCIISGNVLHSILDMQFGTFWVLLAWTITFANDKVLI